MKLLTIIIGSCMVAVSFGAELIVKFTGEDLVMACTIPSWPTSGTLAWHYYKRGYGGMVVTLYDYVYITDARAERYELVHEPDTRTSTLTVRNLDIDVDSAKYDLGHYDWPGGWQAWYCSYKVSIFPPEDKQYEGQCFTYPSGVDECSSSNYKAFICDSGCKPPVDCSSNPYKRCGPLSDNEQKDVLDTHNQLRQLIASGGDLSEFGGTTQPIGTNIYELVYDHEIAKLAQGWAEHNIWKHDCGYCRKGGALSKFTSMGQNMMMTGADENAWTDTVRGWFSEVQNYNYETNSRIGPGKATGHYTQVVWSSSKFLGCGVLQGDWEEFNYGIFVCNYFPAGNGPNRPYSTTEQCPNGNSSTYPDLCKH